MSIWFGAHNRSGLFALAALLGLWSLRFLVLRLLAAGAPDGAGRRARDVSAGVLRTPSAFWCVALALHIGLKGMELPASVRGVAANILVGLVILSVTLVVANLGGLLAERIVHQVHKDAPVTGLLRALIQGLVLILGLLVLLKSLGVAISPLLTALGVGGLAVALALQDTLANLFAGVHITVEHPFRVGHFVRLEDGLEGYVTDIGWRSTQIRTRTDNLVVLPNSKIASATLVNFHMPRRHLRIAMDIGLALESDPEEVEPILLEVLNRAAQELDGAVVRRPPDIWLVEIGADRQIWRLRLDIAEYARREVVLHALHKRCLAALRAHDLTIAVPLRKVQLDQALFKVEP
jgi:small-conductance mechanosensitive channel